MSGDAETGKRAAAAEALKLVEPGMKLGLGSGSTANHFVGLLGEAVRGGLDVSGVPSSSRTEALAREAGIRLDTLEALAPLDLTVDGADEIGPELTLIKGGGGALLREKMVAQASGRMVVIADEAKHVPVLGAFPLPVEVVKFGSQLTAEKIAEVLREDEIECEPTLRRDAQGDLFVTDEGHHIVDCPCGMIEHPATIAFALSSIAGVVDHGLFVGMASDAIIGTAEGKIMRFTADW